MNETLDALLKALNARGENRWGIRTAKDYLSGLTACLGDCSCALTHSKFATPEQWQKAIDEAAGRLCYSDDQTNVLSKSMFSLPPTPKAALDFACVLTSTRRDRDWDVLESAGAELDEKMPLLWQHIPMSPIGTLKSVLSKNDHNVQVHFAIADTELGRDAATLVEFGALRMSHGFKPLEAEPMADGKGWHCKRISVVEGSLVSIPANPSATILAFSREKLHHPIVKGWAKNLFDARPKSVTVPANIEQIEGDKAGRVLSADNDRKIKSAHGMLGEVIQSNAHHEAPKSETADVTTKGGGKGCGCSCPSCKKCGGMKSDTTADVPETPPAPEVKHEPTFAQLASLIIAKSDTAKLSEVECLIASLQVAQKTLHDHELNRQLRELLETQA